MFRRDPVRAALGQAGEVLGLGRHAASSLEPLLRGALRHGGVIGVMRGGQALILPLGGVAATGTFELASLTKPFTSALVEALLAQGHMAWDERLSALGGPLRRLPLSLTARSLATHTAGLPYHPARTVLTMFTQFSDPYGGMSAADVLASARRWARPVGRAGPRFLYSNLGVGVLALAAAYAAGEELSAAGYGAALRRWVTQPLGLRQISLAPVAGELVTPRSLLGGAAVTAFGSLVGAGGLYGTASDLLAFAEQRLRDRGSASWREAMTPAGLTWPRVAVAPGWFYSALDGPSELTGQVVWHDGVARGTRTALGFNTATGAVVVVLARGGLPVVGHRALVPVLALRLLGARLSAR